MSTIEECRRFGALLDQFQREGVPDPVPPELEAAFAHFESCDQCGLQSLRTQEILGAVAREKPGVPDDQVLSTSLDQVMQLIRSDSVAAEATPQRRSSPGLANSRRRVTSIPRARGPRTAGIAVGLALAASVAIFVTTFLGRSPFPAVDSVAVREANVPPVEIVAVEAIGGAELSQSDDAWLLARAPDFGLGFEEEEQGWQVEELSNDELDSLEGLLGTAPGLS